MECGVLFHLSPRAQDLALRAAGLLIGAAGALAIASLYRILHVGRAHETTLAELALAASGFVGGSLGAVLLALGGHLLDPVELSTRWTHRSEFNPRSSWIPAAVPGRHAGHTLRAVATETVEDA